MFMKLMSFSEVEYGEVGKYGQRDVLGRFWSFVSREEPQVLDLFVVTPGALPIPAVGTVYKIIPRNEKTKGVEPGLLGHDRKGDRWYRILPFAGGE
jgi:hypothetical protein